MAYARTRMGDDWAACFPMDGYDLSNAQLRRLGLADGKGVLAMFDIDGYLAMLARLAADPPDRRVRPGIRPQAPRADRRAPPGARGRPAHRDGGNYLALGDPAWLLVRRFLDAPRDVEAADTLRESRLSRASSRAAATPAPRASGKSAATASTANW